MIGPLFTLIPVVQTSKRDNAAVDNAFIGVSRRYAAGPEAVGMSNTTSVSLLHRLQTNGNDEAWSRFDSQYRAFVFGFLKSRGLDDHLADDVCQNVLKHVYEAITDGQFQHNGNRGAFRNWLRKVVSTQLALLRRRSKRNEKIIPFGLETEFAEDDSQLAKMWDDEHNRTLVAVLVDLLKDHTSPESLDIFRRISLEGTSPEVLAKELGRTKNAVVVAKCKVLKKARELAVGLSDL